MEEKLYGDEHDLILSVRFTIKEKGAKEPIKSCESKRELSYLYRGLVENFVSDMCEEVKQYMKGNTDIIFNSEQLATTIEKEEPQPLQLFSNNGVAAYKCPSCGHVFGFEVGKYCPSCGMPIEGNYGHYGL